MVHRNPRILLDVVDDQWRHEKLPNDEIAIAPEHDVPAEDTESIVLYVRVRACVYGLVYVYVCMYVVCMGVCVCVHGLVYVYACLFVRMCVCVCMCHYDCHISAFHCCVFRCNGVKEHWN